MTMRKNCKRDDTILKAKNRLEDSNLEIRLRLMQRDIEQRKLRLERQIEQILDFQEKCKRSSGDSIEIYKDLVLKSHLSCTLPTIDPDSNLPQNLPKVPPEYSKRPKLTTNHAKITDAQNQSCLNSQNIVSDPTKRMKYLEPLNSELNNGMVCSNKKDVSYKSMYKITSNLKSIKTCINNLSSSKSVDSPTVTCDSQGNLTKHVPYPLKPNRDVGLPKRSLLDEHLPSLSNPQTSRVNIMSKIKSEDKGAKNVSKGTNTDSYNIRDRQRNPKIGTQPKKTSIIRSTENTNFINLRKPLNPIKQPSIEKNISAARQMFSKPHDSTDTAAIIAKISSELNIPYPFVSDKKEAGFTQQMKRGKQNVDTNYYQNRFRQKGRFQPEHFSNSDISDESCSQSSITEDGNYIMYKGHKLRNYIKPQERFKIDQVSMIRKKKQLLLKLLRNRPSDPQRNSLDHNFLTIVNNNTSFTEPAKEKNLERLVKENMAKPAAPRPDIDRSQLDTKVQQFMESLEGNTDYCLI